ncbi:CPBP family intramembrane metalloprotease [Massilia dura]|uniref:CPBP family intramembrane metalloprotease n=1 Tax=Pseudoduganella dura TaxID=321982 RepID=A0A6I3XL38_9BURK|nr:CPBP family intramembrane glutamic endopeptidase [Pseudoduganella dura]MUI14361.1 CPBP family intramembrane metalloprotease [Pseudoduganella dura]GGY05397.1 CAAX amino protease [Pseudoduganella dura]
MNTAPFPASSPSPRPSLGRRLLANAFVRTLLAILSVLVPMAVTLGLSEIVPKPYRSGWPLLLAACAIVAGYRLYVRKIEKRDVTELSLAGARGELFAGLGLGALLMATCSVLLLAGSIYTYTGMAHWSALLKPLPEQVFVAFLEELLFRAVLFRLLEKSWGTSVALAVSTLLFIAAHLPSEHISLLGVLATAVASAALSAGYIATRRLWVPIGMHFAWNYLFDAVFSIPVSGHPANGWIQVRASGPEWLSGGGYGVEGSIVAVLAWGAAAIVLLVAARRRNQWLARP